MSDEKTLLPCPICGGQPDFQHFNITPKVKGRIICACGIELRQGENETEDDVRIIWNTRATLGRGTCRMEKQHMDWRCTGCGEIVGTDDPTSELFIDGNAVELWRYCPNCGRRIEVDA